MNGAIRWFAANGVAANLMMLVILVGGAMTAFQLRQEVFPEIEPGLVTVSVVYPGAAPEEVESGVVTRIEEALQGIEGVEEVTSVAAESVGTVTVEVLDSADPREVLDDVKSRVDAIDTFPEEIEQPVIQDVVVRRQVINVAVSGDLPEATLKARAERVRDDLLATDVITQVDLSAARPYEISVEVSERDLRRFGLTFDEVAQAVRRGSLDLPGGSIRTEGGEILLRTEGQAYRSREFETIPLRTRSDGTRLLLGDVATVVDGFAETDQAARFDGEPAVLVRVFRVGDQDALEVADAVHDYVDETAAALPEGLHLTTWQDESQILRSRLDLLIDNGRTGLLLVLLVLALFLKLRLAGWVALGIPISFLGAIAFMPVIGVTINLISLFAFIVVLGIVVDDAIVVGENIYTKYQQGEEGLAAAVAGAQEMGVPVTFAILTTIAAFAPLLFISGTTGEIMQVIPKIVIFVLLFSLVESLFILPAHLSHLKQKDREREQDRRRQDGERPNPWKRFQRWFAGRLDVANRKLYVPFLSHALAWRYVTLATGLALLVLLGGVVAGGWLQFTFFPAVEADNAVADLAMPLGTPVTATADAIEKLERAALDLQDEIERETGQEVFRHVLTSIGEQPALSDQSGGPDGGGRQNFAAPHLGEVNIELLPAEEREVSSAQIVDRWREKTGQIAGASELTFSSSLFSTGDAIDVRLSGPDLGTLDAAAEAIQERLARYPGVQDITDSFREGKEQIELEITPEAQSLGLTLADLGRQVRNAFYGAEAQRIQRGRDEVKVMVRYPERERQSLGDLDDLRIRAPGGVEIPFAQAARAELGRGFSTIQRTGQRRTINVTADVDSEQGNANEILADLESNVLPALLADFPGVRWSFQGEQEEQRKTISGLQRGFAIALLVIYALLAVPFRSYSQPLIVMSAIPFGLIGAIGGHLLMGLDLTILSGFGIVALTGVVVNDSLVMVDYINRTYRAGTPLSDAIRTSGSARFRPILLTSLTTFAGLLPLLLEQSVQAQFLIPMAVSLAFGVLFATVITLILVPVLYRVLEDLKAGVARLLGKDSKTWAGGGKEGAELPAAAEAEVEPAAS